MSESTFTERMTEKIVPAVGAFTNLRPVIFEGLTLTPWIDDKACRSNPGERHKCRAHIATRC